MKKTKPLNSLLSLFLAVILALTSLSFTVDATEGEDAQEAEEEKIEEEEEEEEEEENWVAPEAKPVLLVVSFGTSFNENRAQTIDVLEQRLAEAFPEYEQRRAFTSHIIINKLHARDGERFDDVTQALYRCLADGVKEVLIVPTHVMPGYEFHDVLDDVLPFKDLFEDIHMSLPLLNEDADFDQVREILLDTSKGAENLKTAYIYMGHGTSHKANAVYQKMHDNLQNNGHPNYFVGTVEGTPTLEDVMELVKAGDFEKVVLIPFMIVAGDHANNDMAGDEEDSWASQFKAAGYEVEPRLEGMGSYEGIADVFIEHAKNAIDFKTLECHHPEAASADWKQAEGQEANTAVEGPLKAEQIADGEYAIEVESSSSMFNIVAATLKVEDGKMSCDMTMSGQGYLYLFMGTGEAAADADEGEFISFEEDAEGNHHFIVPVEALEEELDCAAFSKRKEQWYDRVLVFHASEDVLANLK